LEWNPGRRGLIDNIFMTRAETVLKEWINKALQDRSSPTTLRTTTYNDEAVPCSRRNCLSRSRLLRSNDDR
jgi:hypothetical protein